MSDKLKNLYNDSDKLETFFHVNAEKGTTHTQYTQDISKILESNKIDRDISSQQGVTPDMQKVASIPNVVVMEWLSEGINVMNPNEEDIKRIKKKLNSPDYAYLRTGGGRL
jgi:hypothetical protein|tara:strand:- start:977 stop:1309 length:333 start_codon:yes stop_codon:yes gene_type:complete